MQQKVLENAGDILLHGRLNGVESYPESRAADATFGVTYTAEEFREVRLDYSAVQESKEHCYGGTMSSLLMRTASTRLPKMDELALFVEIERQT